MLLVKGRHDRVGGAGAGEGGEQVPDGLLHPGVRVERDPPGRVVDQPDRQRHLQFAATGLGPLPADEAGPDEVQLGLAHGAFEPQQQPVPVGVVAGQPRHLQAQHEPGAAHADLGDQALEAFPVGGAGAGLALVGVDGDDRLGGPAQRDAFCRNAYWRVADSVLVSTWRSVDCRTYR